MVKNRNAVRNILSTVFCLLTTVFVHAQAPAWWYARGVVDPSLPAHDYSPVTLGQLKWIAAKAADEMNAYFGAGPNVMAVVNAFVDSGNYIVATVGQVKYVAQPFYDRLNQLELIHTLPPGMSGRRYPWPQYSSGGDYDLATIGQVKYVFSFDSAVDSDGDGFSDWQEEALRHGATISGNVIYSGPQVGQIYVVLAVNADGSRIEQRQILNQPGAFAFNEVPAFRNYWIKAWRDSNGNNSRDSWEAQGDSVLNPIYLTANIANANITLSDPDTDNDTLSDWWEIMSFGSLAQGPNNDPDGDVISNKQEQHFEMDPTLATITFGNATFVDIPDMSRPGDTTMFFPNPGYDAEGSIPCGEEEGIAFASSFYLYALPNPRDEGKPEEQWQSVETYQANFLNYANDALAGTLSRSVFFEVDVLYNDFSWKEKPQPPSTLNTNDPFLMQNAFDRHLVDHLSLAREINIYPVLVLINGPPEYKTASDDDILRHAQYFIDRMYQFKAPVAFVLGCEIPGAGFSADPNDDYGANRANGIINVIRNYISAYYSDAPLYIGVHTQGDDNDNVRLPSNAQFLAYEFNGNPWCGFNKSANDVRNEAVNVMSHYGANYGVHFLEYNMRVTGAEAKEQTRKLTDEFPRLKYNNDKVCLGISRSKL